MNFYKRFIGDIQAKTGHLSCAEMGVYDRLLDHYYSTEQPLPGDIDACCRIARAMTREERKAVDCVLQQFFSLGGGAYTQRKADEMIAEAQPKIEAARTNGKRGGRPRKNQGQTEQKPNGFTEETQGEPEAKASQSQKEIQRPPTPSKGEDPPGFLEFWATWPTTERKVARKQCAEKWRRNGLGAKTDLIVAHVQAMKQTRQWSDGYEPAPLTYINGERWNDGVPHASSAAAEKAFL